MKSPSDSGMIDASVQDCAQDCEWMLAEVADLAGVRARCAVEDMTPQTHDVGRALAER